MIMFTVIQHWMQKYFSDPEAVLLLFLLIAGLAVIATLGSILAPVFASIVIAYLLDWVIGHLERLQLPRLAAILIVYIAFLGLFFITAFILLPAMWEQLTRLFQDIPIFLQKAQLTLAKLSTKFPDYLPESQLQLFIQNTLQDMRGWGKLVLSYSIASIPSLITCLVYLILVPLLVFFFLKDKILMGNWVINYLPKKRLILSQVSNEVKQQIGNYVRGKVTEMFILSLSMYVVFVIMGLKYSILLSFVVGLSALVPYVGSVVITIPVAAVAYLQWGLEAEFAYLIGFYFVIHALDANILVPLLFSEAVNLHPVAIVMATLVFGGIWGFWGIFFAIPLATVVKAVLYAWPHHEITPLHHHNNAIV